MVASVIPAVSAQDVVKLTGPSSAGLVQASMEYGIHIIAAEQLVSFISTGRGLDSVALIDLRSLFDLSIYQIPGALHFPLNPGDQSKYWPEGSMIADTTELWKGSQGKPEKGLKDLHPFSEVQKTTIKGVLFYGGVDGERPAIIAQAYAKMIGNDLKQDVMVLAGGFPKYAAIKNCKVQQWLGLLTPDAWREIYVDGVPMTEETKDMIKNGPPEDPRMAASLRKKT